MSITVSISEELESFVNAQVASGKFSSVEEVIIYALERLKEAVEHEAGKFRNY